MGLLAAEPIIVRLPTTFASNLEMEAALVQVAFRMLWLQPVGAGLSLLASSVIGALGGLLSPPESIDNRPGRLALEAWQSLSTSVVSATLVILFISVATALLPPAIQEGAVRAGLDLPLNSLDALDWLPSIWPYLVLLTVLIVAVIMSRRALLQDVQEMRSIAWMAGIVASVPWLAIYPAWHLASTYDFAVLLAVPGTLLSFCLFIVSRRVAALTGGLFGQLKLVPFAASVKNSLIGASMGAVAAAPVVAFGVTAEALVLPLWGTLSPEGAFQLRAPFESYLSAAYRTQGWWLLGIVGTLWAVLFIGTWMVRQVVSIYQRAMEPEG